MDFNIFYYNDSLGNKYNIHIIDNNTDKPITVILSVNGIIEFISYQGIDRILNIFQSKFYNHGDDLNNTSNLIIENNQIIFNYLLKNEIVLKDLDYQLFKNWIIDSLTPIDTKRKHKLNNIIFKLLNKLTI